MKNPVYEQIQARKVKARLRMLQHSQRVSGNVSQTCRFLGYRGRSSTSGRSGLISPTIILKIFHRHHVGRTSLEKYRPGLNPADAPPRVPGRSVKLDVKFVPRVGRLVSAFINSRPLMKRPDFASYASTITTTPRPPSTSYGKSGSISPSPFREFRPTTARRSDHSLPSIFRPAHLSAAHTSKMP